MSKLVSRKSEATAIAERPVNVDGKGVNGFMLDWHLSEPRGIVAKPQRQVLAEYFTSMLVLSADFKYRPSVGVTNYLYLVDERWVLSLIAPHEWSEERRAGFVGTCVLQRDMTWTIEPADELDKRPRVTEAIGRFYDAFADTLDSDLTLEEILPFFVGSAPYDPRLYSSALSRSIRDAVTIGGHRTMRERDWKQALPKYDSTLLLSRG